MTSLKLLGDSCTTVLTEQRHRKGEERIFSSVWLFYQLVMCSWASWGQFSRFLGWQRLTGGWHRTDSHQALLDPTWAQRHLNLLAASFCLKACPALSQLWHWEGTMLPHAPSQATPWQIWRNSSAYQTFTHFSNVHLTVKNTGSREILF